MKFFIVLMCMAGLTAVAADDRIQGHSLQVKERLAAIERIDVTSKKTADESVPMDDEVAAILAEVEAIGEKAED